MDNENGDYVTRAELLAHINPIKADVWEIKADVKTLLRHDAGVKAVSKWKKFWFGFVLLTLIGLAISTTTLTIQVIH